MSKMKCSEKGLLTPDNCVVTLIDLPAADALRRLQFRPPSDHQQQRGARKAARVFEFPWSSAP